MFYNNILPSRSFTEQDVNSQTEVGCTSRAVQGVVEGAEGGSQVMGHLGLKTSRKFLSLFNTMKLYSHTQPSPRLKQSPPE